MNYTELQARVYGTLENTFELDDFNGFVTRAERKIYASVHSLAQKKNDTGIVETGNRFLNYPKDWVYTHDFALVDNNGRHRHLLRKDVGFIREAYPNPMSRSQPRYYAEYDKDSFILGPTPDEDYAIHLHYGFIPESIVTADETYLSTLHPNALYAAVVIEGAIFLRLEEDTMAEYKDQYKQALLELKQLVDGRQETTHYRDGVPKTGVV